MKHAKHVEIKSKSYKKFVQALENPTVRNLVGSHFGDYISNPKTNLKHENIQAKDTGLLRLEITFHGQRTNEPLTKNFIQTHMKYLKEPIPNVLKYHNSINNQFNLVCKNIEHYICIYNKILIQLQKVYFKIR